MKFTPNLALVIALIVSSAASLHAAERPYVHPTDRLPTPSSLRESAPSAGVRRPVARRALAPRSVWVSLEYNESQDGWERTHFATIQDAIDGVHNRGTVHVAAGTYDESVLINRSLSLVGEGAEVTTIDYGGEGSAVTIEETHDVQVSGFTLTSASGGDGVTIASSTDVTVSGNIISGNQYDGVNAFEVERLVVRGNEISGNESSGIRWAWVVESVISDNSFDNTWPISLGRSYGNLISDNFVGPTKPSGISLSDRSDYNRVIRNTIIDGGCTPIRSAWTSHNLFAQNTIIGGRWGIYLGYVEKSIIADNTIDDVWDGDGIALYHVGDSFVLNNTISNSRFGGITLFGMSQRNTVEGNEVVGGWRGVSLFYGSDGNVITGNAVGGSEHGVIVDGSNGNTLYRNNFTNFSSPAFDNGTNSWAADNYGNFWSDYRGIDGDGDGIGDTPHPILPNNADQYPVIGQLDINAASVPDLEHTPFNREASEPRRVFGQEVWENDTVEIPDLHVISGGSLTIRNCTVTLTGRKTLGFQIDSGASLEVFDSVLNMNGRQITSWAGSSLRIEDSEIHSPGDWEGGGSFWIGADDAVIRNNLITDSWGVQLDFWSSGGIVTGNTILESWVGIAVYEAENVEIANNSILNTIKAGIHLGGIRGGTVTGNKIENVWGMPIYLWPEEEAPPVSIFGNAFMKYRDDPFAEGSHTWHNDGRGNYWEDFLDQHPTAECSTGDSAVWDAPYQIGTEDNEDPYPLVCPPNGAGDPAVPDPPELGSPSDASTATSTEVELSWAAVDGATEYRVQVSSSASFDQPVVNSCDITSESYQATNLDPYTTYFWRVLAMIDGCHGPWSDTWTFTTGPAQR
jgi:parallel beta-helix repeat protein